MKSDMPLFPEVASTVAGQVDALYFYLVAVSVFFTVLIAALIVFFGVKYRRRSQTDRPDEIHGSAMLEITWSVIPLILCMVMFFWGADLFFKMRTPPDDAMEVLVTGKQWMWKLQHPTGRREINELHVPLGQPIKLIMTSEDVIHSFYVPAFRIKQDVLPGRYTTVWFEATKTGKFHLFCAEYCGTEHSLMGGSVYVMTPDEYEEWLTGGVAGLTPAEAGEQLFKQLGCLACHAGGSGQQGPTLNGVFGTEQTLAGGQTVLADEDYIRESILQPQAKILEGYQPIMPTYKGMVSEPQLLQIVAYIKSLGKAAE